MSKAASVPRSLVMDAQPADVRPLDQFQRDALWVSMACVDGAWVGVSRYGDPSWKLGVATLNTNRARLRIDFEAVPSEFKPFAKAVVYRYLRKGLAGGKRPGVKSVLRLFDSILPFLRYVAGAGISRIGDVDELTCKQYVDFVKARPKSGPAAADGVLLADATLAVLFRAVEQLHELSQYSDDPMSTHPWPGSSASDMANPDGGGQPRGGKTLLIPDEHFVKLFQAASSDIDRGEQVLRLRDELDAIEAARPGLSSTNIRKHKNRHLDRSGWAGGLTAFNDAFLDLRTACYVAVGSLTGCRMHELASVENGSCYSTEGHDGEPFWWMRGRSTKTDEGHTEWMIPLAALKALRLMEWWAKPYQALIQHELETRRAADPTDPDIAEAWAHRHAVFLGAAAHRPDLVRTISATTWNDNINLYAGKHQIQWNFASHQFRRKFANYAARSRFGDLRYLKEHFKHWAMDMTLGYALNESQEMALFMEIEEEYDDIKRGVVHDWLDPSEPLAGGYGSNIVAWRGSDEITIFKDRKTMIIAIADSTAIRSNGHAWCTADDDLCVGNDMERSRCTECDNAAIGRIHAHIYQGMYNQLKQTLTLEDIGPGGIQRVKRDLARCRHTLIRLGYDPEPAAHQ